MRISLSIDSATGDEAHDFVAAFQRTRHMGLPPQLTTDPTVTIAGIAFGITTPTMDVERAEAMLDDFRSLRSHATHPKLTKLLATEAPDVLVERSLSN